MLQNVTDCRRLIYQMYLIVQNITDCRCLIKAILRNIEPETTECYKIINLFIEVYTFHKTLLLSIILDLHSFTYRY